MIFLSQRPNTDPERYVTQAGQRMSAEIWERLPKPLRETFTTLDLRPEFTQTRDPKPWITRQSYTHTDRYRYAENVNGVLEWLPRHEEFDTPVNPILAAFREYNGAWPNAVQMVAAEWLAMHHRELPVSSHMEQLVKSASAEAREHAYKIFARIVNVYTPKEN